MDINAWAACSGFYAARNYASMTVSNANPDHVYDAVAGHGTSTTLQFFAPDVARAQAVFHWRVDGVQTNGNPNRLGRAEPRIDFHAITTPGGSWFDLFNGGFENSMTHFGQGSFSYTLPVADLGEKIHLYDWASAFTELQVGEATAGGGFTMTADFGHTYVLESVELLDDSGNALPKFTVQDGDTGTELFNQSGRMVDVLAAPVPEPQTHALWLLGLTGLVAWRRRQAGMRPAIG